MSKHRSAVVALPLAAGLLLAACGSAAKTPTAARAAAQTPAAAPPGGAASPTYTDTGVFTLNDGAATLANRTITAAGADESGVLVKGGGALTLRRSTIRTTGGSKSSDESSFYGLDAGLLAESSGKARLAHVSVSTTGAGANGVFAYGSGARVSIVGGTIAATGQYAHGAMAAGGGSVSLRDVEISTKGASSAAVATDRGGGTIVVHGGKMTTAGYRSPGVYSTGKITVYGAAMTATGAEAAVVEGANSITAVGARLTAARQHGVMLYNSMSGDAAAGTGTYTMTGGSLTVAQGPAFYVTNTRAVITLSKEATVNAASGTLLRADNAGTGSGNTGAGTVSFTALGEKLTGNLITAGTGTIAASLRQATTLTGRIDKAALAIDSTSAWRVTANSALTIFRDTGGISGTEIKNIIGNGHTVTYDAALSANRMLGGKTYKLAGGGELKPA